MEGVKQGIRRFAFINNYDVKENIPYDELLVDKNIHVEQKMELFYSSLMSKIFDIFRVVSDNNCLYTINGEGLIVHISMLLSKFYSFRNEYERNINSVHNCLNVSSIIYYIEKILNDLYACNPSFHIIFFNIFQLFFEHKERKKIFENYNLIRNAFILHCKKNLIPYFIFDNWYGDDNYSIYLKKHQPLFMFIEDGSSFLYTFNKFYIDEVNKEGAMFAASITSSSTEDSEKEMKENHYEDYVEQKCAYDEMHEEVRKCCVCFYFLLMNNILRNIKSVFFYNMEVERNTVNAFSVIYNDVNFNVVGKLNEEVAQYFDHVYYVRTEKAKLYQRDIELLNEEKGMYYETELTDFELIYKGEESYSAEKEQIWILFQKELGEITQGDTNNTTNTCNGMKRMNCINLKNVVLKIFHEVTWKNCGSSELEKKEYMLIVKMLCLHNYLIEKLNMKNLSFLKDTSIHESEKKEVYKCPCRLTVLIDTYVNGYLNVYTYILQLLQKDSCCDILGMVKNVDLLNFFNSAIFHNLIGFLYFKLNENITCFEHSDFNFEEVSFFEKSFAYICGGVSNDYSFFPVEFSFIKKKLELENGEASAFPNGSILKNDNEESTLIPANDSSCINVNLIKIENELIDLFFSLKDVPASRNSKKGKLGISINYRNQEVCYDVNFFDAIGFMHLTDREHVLDVFNSYLKISAKKHIKNILKDKRSEKYIHRWQQQEEKRKSTIAKYFNISSLHLPIIVTENHPWVKYYCRNIYLYSSWGEEQIKKGVVYRMSKMFEIEDVNSEEEEKEEQREACIGKDEKKEKEMKQKDICGANDYDIEETEEERVEEVDEDEVNEIKDIRKGPIKKGQSKKEEILKRKELQTEKKIYEIDLERYEQLEGKVNKLSSDDSYSNMNFWSFDIITGYNRIVDVYNFNHVTNLIKSVDLQVKISMKVLNAMHGIIMYTKLKNVKTAKQKSDAVRSIVLIYKLANEIFTKYKRNLKLKDVLQLQTVLLSLGFTNSSNGLFDEYIKLRKGMEEKKKKKLLEEEQRRRKKDNMRKKTKAEKKAALKERNKREMEMEYVYSSDNEMADENIKIADLEKYRLKSVKNYSELKIDDTKEHEFQLYYMYYLLDRTTGNIKDKRVFFNLDTWQYNILNLVDRRKSVLVSCPTSSGKTFICYYVMDKVLRLNNDSVVVYVAPNDTLALQVYHEVNGRFSTKCFSKNSSNILCSYMTEKIAQEKALHSQILIILPSILEDILFACYVNSENMPNYMGDDNFSVSVQSFVSKIEYIIFDEIHCIGDKDFYGKQIENIIHLSNCPFLALSATIGNIKYFYSWLKNIFIRKGKNPKDLHLIKFYERYSDLIMYVYTNRNLHHLNPLACLNFRDILYKGISKDFYCNPREIYQIVKILFALAKHKGFYHLVEFLQPSFYFQYTRCINKKQFIYFMHTVKGMLVYLIQNKYIDNKDYAMIIHLLLSNYVKSDEFLKKGEKTDPQNDSQKDAQKIEDKEQKEVEKQEEKREDLGNEKSNEVVEKKSPGTKHLYAKLPNQPSQGEREELYKELYGSVKIDERFYERKKSDLIKYTQIKNMEQEYLNSDKLIELLKKLEDGHFLPCIVFNFERSELENMTINLINELKNRQYDKYYGDEEKAFNTRMENKIRQEKYESLLKQREMHLKMKTTSRTQKMEQNLDKKSLEILDDDLMPEKPLDIAEEYDGDFYFCNRKIFYNYESEIENLIKDAESAIEYFRNKAVLIEGLKRGIGLHYELLPYKFTIIVESLFRLGFLKIIFSNKNLSLGINIPCKSIIFAGHALELNSLMFRQMSGRAGRRGFDLYGNIIIWDINFQNLKRLITSPLQTLSGQYSVNFTNICRTMLLYSSMVKKKELDDLKNKKSQPVANKPVNTPIPNKKKKKVTILSVAEKEAIFEDNRKINIDFYYRINGLLSMYFNSLYFISAFQEENEKKKTHHTLLSKQDKDSEVSTNRNHIDTKTEDSGLDKTNKGGEGEDGSIKSDRISFLENEFDTYKNIKETFLKFLNRKYEYNEILCEFLTNINKRKYRTKNEVQLKEIYFMIKTHFLMFLNVLIEIGALDDKGGVINLTELSIFLKGECDNNFIFTYLLIQRILHLMIGDTVFLAVPKNILLNKILESITYEKNYSRSILVDEFSRRQLILLFIFSHFINKIKENNITVTGMFINFNKSQRKTSENYSSFYFPLLHDIPKAVLKYINYLSSIILKYLKYYALLIFFKFDLIHKKHTYLLPFTELYIFDEHPSLTLEELLSGGSTYFNYVKATVRDYKVRSPFLVSMFGGDEFQNIEEMLTTCLNDLNIKKNMVPDLFENKIYFYKFVDGLIKEEAVCLENSYILDYFIHGKPDSLQKKNKLGHHTWHIIYRFLNALRNIEHVYYEMKRHKMNLNDDLFYQALNTVKGTIEKYIAVFNTASPSK